MHRHPIANARHRRCRWGFHHHGAVHEGPIVVDGKHLPARTCLRCGVISTISPITAGTGFTWTAGFNLAPDGVPTNPTSVSFIYQPGNAPQVTLPMAALTNTAVGVFSAQVNTSGLAGAWTLEAVGTGACTATVSVALTVVPLPLG